MLSLPCADFLLKLVDTALQGAVFILVIGYFVQVFLILLIQILDLALQVGLELGVGDLLVLLILN